MRIGARLLVVALLVTLIFTVAVTSVRSATTLCPPDTKTNCYPLDPGLPTQIAKTQVSTWKCQDQLPQQRTAASVEPWALPKSDTYRRWVLNLWKLRLNACNASLAEKKRQWNWQAWLPDKWRRIAYCETGMNWQHGNSGYAGAFGFAHSSWDAFKLPGYPDEAWQASPWQQYQVALQIYARYGLSGWGCRNA